LFSPGWSLAAGVGTEHGVDDVATAAMHGHYDPRRVRVYERRAARRQHIPPWKSSTKCRKSISPIREVLGRLRLEIDWDDALTAFEGRAEGAESWHCIRKSFCS
jgi:hypothetical protein